MSRKKVRKVVIKRKVSLPGITVQLPVNMSVEMICIPRHLGKMLDRGSTKADPQRYLEGMMCGREVGA
jgi:hypothetical protein